MPSWPLTTLREWAKSRPPGYLEDLLARAHLADEGETVTLNDAAYAELSARYRPAPPSRPPSLPRLAATAARAIGRFAASGFQKAPEEIRLARQALCHTCPDWDAEGYAGLGRCRKCGCSGIKLSWASEQCPLGKWGRVDSV